MSFEVRTAWEPWPTDSTAHELLSPGAALIGLYDDGEPTGMVRRWVRDGTRWLTRWPLGATDREPLAPTLFFSADSDAESADVWFEAEGFDAQEHLLARMTLEPSRSPSWHEGPPAGPVGHLVSALADLVVEAHSPRRETAFPQGEVIALPGPQLPGLPADLALRSWHARHGGRALRAVEMPPSRDLEEESLRARRAQIFDAEAPLSPPGLVLWREGDLRLWRGGEDPLLDPPCVPGEYSALEALLVEHLGRDQVMMS